MIVDLHSHILPGVDDGAYTMDDAVEMARQAAHSGVQILVATPHYRYYGHDNQSQIQDAYDRLVDCLAYHQIPVKLELATELWLSPEHRPSITPAMTYPATNYFLAEFSVDETPGNMNAILQHYADRGFVPVVAHPERYFALREDPILARSWVEKGWGVQLNRDSLLGKFGRGCYECAVFMLHQGWANLIASDAHWLQERNLDWSEALQRLYHDHGHRIINPCVKENPLKILKGERL